MEINIIFAIFAIGGFFLMGGAIFGKKEDIDSFKVGSGSISTLVELIYEFTYIFSPTLIKRILLFLLGLITAVISIIIILANGL
ncbi:hypothetical protein M2M59_13905 [Rummeliibacillus sp. G93]|uniref:hypothetical protein n=1 Tax=Rummeliibacillus TaxID=648802 RepID=UPI00201C815E|nr:hypothetical protein [Rummeliibacillus sp. G93]UQW97009.1 hypothetical protein M2M59_13905 [Rummeliibacillus sp. G93]